MVSHTLSLLHSGWMLMRPIAVITSSIAVIISSLLPLYLFTNVSTAYLTIMVVFLSITAVVIHGVLTHALNDITDYYSGTDDKSPAILSGGSRVIQTGLISVKSITFIGKWLTIILLALVILLFILSKYKLALFLLIGVWAATSYSLPPLRLSYRPFLGEWLCLFPALFMLGIAGPLLVLETLPLWATQNAIINALFCMAWVMVHHIPDLEADRQAVPMKQTTVVWLADKFGPNFARVPALIYLLLTGLCILWTGIHRPLAAITSGILIFTAIIFVMKINTTNPVQTSMIEKILLLIAVGIAMTLGIFHY